MKKLFAFAAEGGGSGDASDGMVRIEGGVFQMGDYYQKPVHTVTVKSFYIGKYEVTQKEWYDVMGTTILQHCGYSSDQCDGVGDNYPMYYVNWYDAIEYCNARSMKEGLTPAYTIDKSQKDRFNKNKYDVRWTVQWNRNANGFRLPTEAEWEYAARGGNGSSGLYTYAGSNNVNEVAWHENNSAESTHEVGTKAPNSLGLYDMSGNVWEWCWDWFGKYPRKAQTDPIGASSGSDRVKRGGSSNDEALYARTAYRLFSTPDSRSISLGFRVVRPAQ